MKTDLSPPLPGHVEACPWATLASLRAAWAGFWADLTEHTQVEDQRLFPMFRR